MFQFNTYFANTKLPLNLALNPHLLYTLLPAVYFFINILKIITFLLVYIKISRIFTP